MARCGLRYGLTRCELRDGTLPPPSGYGAVRLRALPFFLVQQGCLRVGVSRCGPAAVVGGGVRCFVGVNLSFYRLRNAEKWRVKFWGHIS